MALSLPVTGHVAVPLKGFTTQVVVIESVFRITFEQRLITIVPQILVTVSVKTRLLLASTPLIVPFALPSPLKERERERFYRIRSSAPPTGTPYKVEEFVGYVADSFVPSWVFDIVSNRRAR